MAFSLFGKKDKNKADELVEQDLTQRVEEIPLNQIMPNQFQPRTVFDQEKIEELAETIKIHGLIQPIVLREIEENSEETRYEIIAGERRYRAAVHLEMETIPAIVQEFTDDESAALALIENLQREQLTPIEEAVAYQSLLEMNGVTQEALAKQVGKSQSAVANKLRLLKLPKGIQESVLAKEISERHARSLLALESEEEQLKVLDKIRDNHLSVKQTDELIRELLMKKDEKPKKKAKLRLVSKDARIALNTIKESVSMVQKGGMDLNINEQESDEFFEITIQIPKNKK
ncbi:nucleoid occlusion protein [Listeria kieliensis]|uniref:Chromosome partitioning protein ParB n=1 Tax=Listeria kieliensis TaxID=1621700 RepID=A0A3D8TR63_9LIST|nr:nucleoid occlusion protein [Listeria kieliensis]RDX01275.1 chromosome partitioning protein ParB [Listeria kieliensis]